MPRRTSYAWVLLVIGLLGGCALAPVDPQQQRSTTGRPIQIASPGDETLLEDDLKTLEGPADPVQVEALPKQIDISDQQTADSPPAYEPEPVPADAAAHATTANVEHDDLWDRIAHGFALAGYDHPRVGRERSWLIKRPEYLNRVVERAEPYLHLIVEAVEARGVPSEIALLPIIESAFQPFAYSKGRAAGLWQFIPSTGKNFGLKQTWWYDGRRDVLAATEAALDYLQKLNAMFDGDWLLSLAAYNAGEGTVMRAVNRNRAAGRPTDYWSLKLPNETMGYVPKLLAVSQVFSEPETFGLQLASIENRAVVTEVQTAGQIDLARAAELAGLTIEELHRLNPGFNRWATDPDGPHHLLLPIDRAEAFDDKLASLDDRERMRWQRHRIEQGESLISIAMKYATTPDVLRRVNQIDGDLIRAGHHLLIPSAGGDIDYPANAEQLVASLADRTLPPAKRKVTHAIRSGESYWKVARRYGVSVRQLVAWNGGDLSRTLQIGEQLTVWLPNPEAVVAQRHSGAPLPAIQSINYTVRQGDSLFRISRLFNVTIDDLLQWNRLDKGGLLQPGQLLVVRVDITTVSERG